MPKQESPYTIHLAVKDTRTNELTMQPFPDGDIAYKRGASTMQNSILMSDFIKKVAHLIELLQTT